MLRIGSLGLALPAVQAALSGYSDLPMRRVARARGAPFCFHEVVLDRLLLEPGKLQRAILDVAADDHPVGGQLMGNDPATLAIAARYLVEAGYDLVDINFGCPVPRVLGRCRGGFLLGEPERALEIVDRVLEACAGEVPVTVKLRRGVDGSDASERAFFTILEGVFERGAAAVTVHARTVRQRYNGPSDWSFLSRAKARVGDRVVLGSGDLFSPYDVQRMLTETGVDGVTVARGGIGNPWIFAQLADLLAGREPQAPTVGEQRTALEEHAACAMDVYGERRSFGKIRAHSIKYASVHPRPLAVRDAFVAARQHAEWRAVLDRLYPAEDYGLQSAQLVANSLNSQILKDCGVAGGEAQQ